ncbi:MAG: hypothetical protein KC777_25400 [Cyanobacteria bacterium HKST-UBA02]|nr:hypothetical protein [Cyanobacteria bacterium HKST-UBA02]
MDRFETSKDVPNPTSINDGCMTNSRLAGEWMEHSRQLIREDLKITTDGTYRVQFGDSLSAIARRSLRMQGDASPGADSVLAEQRRIVALNAERYPHLERNPGYIWETMTLRLAPKQDPEIDSAIEQNIDQGRNQEVAHEPILGSVSMMDGGPADERSKMAPEAPVEDDFKGIDLGIIKLGYKPGDHAVAFGFDIGVLDFDAQLGRESAVGLEAGLGDLAGVKGGAGIGFDRQGLHTSANGRGRLLKDNVSGGGEVSANLGPKSGIGANGDAHVGPVGGAAGGDVSLDHSGLNAGYDASGGFKDVIDGHTDGELSLSRNSHVGAGGGVSLFDNSLDVDAGVGSAGNTIIRPAVALTGKSGDDSLKGQVHGQIGSGLDLSLGALYRQQGSEVSDLHGRGIDLGIGMSGAGVQASRVESGRVFVSRHGVGKFRSSNM